MAEYFIHIQQAHTAHSDKQGENNSNTLNGYRWWETIVHSHQAEPRN